MYIEKKTIEQYRDKNRLTSPRHITPYMSQNEYFNTFCEEEAASVITIENQWTIEQHQSFIVTKPSQGEGSNAPQDVLSRCYTLQSHFHVNDYNRVNDYHLIINEIKLPTFIFIDEQMVTYIEPEDTYHRINVTPFVQEGHNHLKMICFPAAHWYKQAQIHDFYESMHIVARGYDRIEDFDIFCQFYPTLGVMQPTLHIKDIEGAPQITYQLLDQFGDILQKGDIDIDTPNCLDMDTISIEETHIHHLTLMLETQDEVIMHDIQLHFLQPLTHQAMTKVISC
ncbi:hypothetical protein [Staphylococcus chromogenes]|uniref:hypothetical protein n=2 Tax=Staphylococcus chromogenes TaxID=46126 RepID=UPI000D1A34BF|nr:hypothetical protein [Staphylococcus chromogenes]PTG21889.1 hypothetical protein BU637_02700 [Staphylococcus chromogenes]